MMLWQVYISLTLFIARKHFNSLFKINNKTESLDIKQSLKQASGLVQYRDVNGFLDK